MAVSVQGSLAASVLAAGGPGLVLDGSDDAAKRAASMLLWDVNNGVSRRSWAGNDNAEFAIKRAMEAEPRLVVTVPSHADEALLASLRTK